MRVQPVCNGSTGAALPQVEGTVWYGSGVELEALPTFWDGYAETRDRDGIGHSGHRKHQFRWRWGRSRPLVSNPADSTLLRSFQQQLFGIIRDHI